MNTDRFEGSLKQLGGMMKERWGKFTNDSQRELEGMRDQRTGRSQQQYGKSKEEAARQLKEFFDRNNNWHRWNR
jgi:uncharacterized protein YjbJ (UPF0337 family)